MFFLKNKKLSNQYLQKNFLNKKDKLYFWRIFFLGFFFDEIFSIFLKNLNKNFFSTPAVYFFDKYISHWFSYNFFKKKFFYFSNFFFLEKLNYSFFVVYLVLSMFIFFLFFYVFLTFI